VNLKCNQSSLQKTITFINFFGKGSQEWKNSCVVARLSIKMFKTLVTICLLHMSSCFKKTLEYQYKISICYKCQQVFHLSFKMLMCFWDMFYSFVETLLPIDMCFEPKFGLLIIIMCICFYFHIVHYYEG
jgi:hypothetical protein